VSGTAPVVVAGAGIAGLAAAIALARRGIAVEVFERAAALAEIGAGLQLSPNAVHALDRLGLRAAVTAVAVAPEAVRIASVARGRAIARVPLGASAAGRHGAPYLLVARADLQAVLIAAAAAEPGIRLTLGCPVAGAEEAAGGVRVATASGDILAHALVGADGVRSAVRAVVGGRPAVATGKVAFRATAPRSAAEPLGGAALGDDAWIWLSPRAHLVHYPMRGGTRVNLVAVAEASTDERPNGGTAVTGSGDTGVRANGNGANGNDGEWNHAAAAEAVLRRFGDFPQAVRALLSAGEDWRRWPLSTVDPAGPWARGRTVLIGDAAHAMVPFLAQGAAMAIEDAVVLADHLAGADGAEAALAAYVRSRRERVRQVWAGAARNGDIYHLGGIAAAARDTALSLAPPSLLLAGFDWLYGWRPAAAG
jgi:salicylate hydroxylase